MIRMLVVGNSHAGAIKLGWESLKDAYANRVDVGFFALPMPYFTRLTRVGSEYGLVPAEAFNRRILEMAETINDRRSVDLGAFQHILLVGHDFQLAKLAAVLRKHAVDGLPADNQPHRLSAAAFREIVAARFAEAALPAHWSAPATPPVTVLLRARPSESIRRLKAGQAKPGQWDPSALRPDAVLPFFRYAEDALEAHLTAQGMAVARQPAATLTDEGWTQDRFSVGSRRLLGFEHEASDLNHMNGDYGQLCLKSVLDQLLDPN